jgi:chromosome segregation ATPase
VDVSKAENAVASYESARRREYDELYSAESAERRRKRTDLGDAEQAVTNLTRSIAADKAEHAKIEARLLTLRGEFARIKAEAEAGFQGSTDCPACGQELPADRREEAVAKFNNAIATRRGDNMAEGKKTAARAKEMAEQIRQACAELTAAQETVDRLRAEIDNMGEPAPFTVDKSAPDYAALVARVTRLKRELADSAKADTTEIDAKISRLEAMRQKHDADCAVIAQQASIEARIKKLTEDEAAATATAEELRFNLDLIESFVRAKVKMVTCVINSHFKMAEFKLFSEQVNGGIKECCDITYAGVPWGSLNTGHKIRTALDVIATFQQVYNFSAPVWVDNAESNNEWPAMDCQIIRLYVSHDPALRVGFPTIAELLRVTADKATGGNDYDTRTDEGAEPTEQGELF